MNGGTYPVSSTHGFVNFASPYPQRFLEMVATTKIEPAAGLYESTAYVDAIAGSAATCIPAQPNPMITIAFNHCQHQCDERDI